MRVNANYDEKGNGSSSSNMPMHYSAITPDEDCKSTLSISARTCLLLLLLLLLGKWVSERANEGIVSTAKYEMCDPKWHLLRRRRRLRAPLVPNELAACFSVIIPMQLPFCIAQPHDASTTSQATDIFSCGSSFSLSLFTPPPPRVMNGNWFCCFIGKCDVE